MTLQNTMRNDMILKNNMRSESVYENFGPAEEAADVNSGVVELVNRNTERWYRHVK